MKKPFLSLEETFFFSLQYFPTSKAKTRINIQTLGLNNKTLQNQIKQADLFNQNSTKTRNYKFDSLNKKNDFYCKSLEMRKLRPCEVKEGLARWGRSNNVCRLRQGEGGREERPARWRMERHQRGMQGAAAPAKWGVVLTKWAWEAKQRRRRYYSSESESVGENGRWLGREWEGERMGLRDLGEKWVFYS